MIDEERFEQMLDRARDEYGVPREPDTEAMWRAIEREAWPRQRTFATARGVSRTAALLAAAATLVIGVGVGRWSAARPPLAPAQPVAASGDTRTPVTEVADVRKPLERTTSDYLGQTAALLQQLEAPGAPKGAYTAQATTLLATTRLLLDSPATSDTRLHGLLEDLELVLAQIAALPTSGAAKNHEELKAIRSTLVDRDVVPRVQTAAVSLAAFEY